MLISFYHYIIIIIIIIIIITRVSAAFGRQNPRLDGREITSPEDYQSGR